MSNAAARSVVPVLTEADIANRIDAYVQRNVIPMVAAEHVIADLFREGLAHQLMEAFGPPLLFEVWESTKRRGPTSQVLAAAGKRGAERQREIAALRAAGSILESLVEIDGRWKRFGDLDRAACKKLAGIHKRQALAVAARARFYHAVSERITDGQTVRDALDDATLTALRAEAAR